MSDPKKTPPEKSAGKKKLSLMALVLINVSAVLSLRGLPAQAEEGYAIVFYLIVGALLFFIPSALVSAELASGWQQKGGVFLWVKEAFGAKWGFLAIFMQWVQNIPWFPAVITFIATAIAFIVNPALAENKLFVFVFINVLLWGCTLLNMKGSKWSTFLSSTGATAGVLIPGALLIVAGVVYLLAGNPPETAFQASALIPDLSDPSKLLMLVSMLVGLSGIEMSAVHVTEVDDPGKNFPKAILIATGIIILVNILATLAITVIVPLGQISASEGIFEAFELALGKFGIQWLAPVIFVLIAYGAFASVATWLVGPSQGVLQAAKEGYLPDKWQRTNTEGVPTTILIIQACISSVLSISVLVTASVQDAFLLMGSLTALLYMTMYVLMFAAAIRLRYKAADTPRPYCIPGGKVGIWALCGLGILACLAVAFCGFLPPSDIGGGWAMAGYYAFIVIGYAALIIVPFVFYNRSQRKKASQPNNKATL